MKNSEFNEVMSLINKFNLPVYCYENLCVGSGARLPSPTINDFALYQWRTAREHLSIDQKVNIIGFSMGGMIAATMCLLNPDRVSKLILVSTAVNSVEIPAVSDPLFNTLCSIKTPEDLLDSLKIGFSLECLETRPDILGRYFEYRLSNGNQQTSEEFIAQLRAVREFPGVDVYQKLRDLNIEIIHIHGAGDRLFGQDHVHQLKPYVQRQVSLSGHGHMLHLENPMKLAEILTFEINDSAI